MKKDKAIKQSDRHKYADLFQKEIFALKNDLYYQYCISKKSIAMCVLYESIAIESRQSELETALTEVEKFFLSHGLEPKNEAYMSNAFMEMLLNAYEHGNLQISHDEKSKHMEQGTFDDILQEREVNFGDRKITISLHVKDDHRIKTFKVEVSDEGKGFDTGIMRNKFSKKELYNGRGLVMVSKMVDAFYYNYKGNKVILKKFQKKEY